MKRLDPSKRIAEARELLARMRAALLSPAPEAIERELPALEEALRCLRTLQPKPGFQEGPKPGFQEGPKPGFQEGPKPGY